MQDTTLRVERPVGPDLVIFYGENYAGRIKHFLPAWMELTSDQWILQSITGYQIEFIHQPWQIKVPNQIRMNIEQQKITNDEIMGMLTKGAIKKVQQCHQQFISTIFIVPKKTGGFRPVFNLKRLNRFVKSEHFKMESIQMTKQLIQKDNWMISVDLRDAYFMIPIHPEHKKYLRFEWGQDLFEFQVVPFGLKSAPRVFTKIMKPIMAHLRQRTMKVIIYIDDLLLIAHSWEECQEHKQFIIQLFQKLGLVINWEKSQLIPCQQIRFLGHIIDSRKMTLSLPEEKVLHLQALCHQTIKKPILSAESLASLLGKMTASAEDVVPAPVFFRTLQMDLIVAVKTDPTYQSMVSLSQGSIQELQWWAHCLWQWNGKPMNSPQPALTITSDASMEGWGAHCGQIQTGGRWTPEEKSHHINYLELLAAFLALQTFAHNKQDCHILMRMDNTTAIAYVKHKGGTRTAGLSQLAIEMWKWCMERKIILSAHHVPGKENCIADFQSRVFMDRLEWKLHPQIFRRVCQKLSFQPTIDLFASRINHQVPRYAAWKPDPGAIITDAFSTTWTNELAFVFPPFCLLPHVLRKVKEDRATVLLIAPTWTTQIWYPMLLELTITNPILLPQWENVLFQPHSGQPHPLSRSLHLAAWLLCGDDLERKVSHKKSLMSCWIAADPLLINNMSLHGQHGVAGVRGNKLIQFQHL